MVDVGEEGGGEQCGVLGVLQEDAAAAVLAHVPPQTLLLCSTVNHALQNISLSMLSLISVVDLSVLDGSLQVAGHMGGLDMYSQYWSVRKAYRSGRGALCAEQLRLMLHCIPSLTALSLRGRLLRSARDFG